MEGTGNREGEMELEDALEEVARDIHSLTDFGTLQTRSFDRVAKNRQTEVVPVNIVKKRKMNTQEFLEEEKFDSNPKNTKLSIEERK
ncbi:hypothetical protein IEQ34_011818 [Dendrobium chrysotoxum]|uniref:Uncharacterized protein n=1 Tax=Dendrobium chrysotoxum TaxID=161865 RepID=A0AAV7GTX5_DENCH|nr:hypothetical protein IEQ34_011818 [Dendrobium chrysotoxum]